MLLVGIRAAILRSLLYSLVVEVGVVEVGVVVGVAAARDKQTRQQEQHHMQHVSSLAHMINV
jgi:hypothetical protein